MSLKAQYSQGVPEAGRRIREQCCSLITGIQTHVQEEYVLQRIAQNSLVSLPEDKVCYKFA